MTATNSLTVENDEATLIDVNPDPVLTFSRNGGDVIGELRRNDGILSFSGNADESAKILFESVIKIHNDFACPKCEQKVNA